MRKKRVLVFGTFDGIHRGHLSFLRQARRHGDFLIGVVARDSAVKRMKRKKALNGERERLRELRRHVDMAVMGERKVAYRLIKTLRPDVICIGYDQRPGMREAREVLKRIGMPNVRLRKMRPYKPKRYKSSVLNRSDEPR